MRARGVVWCVWIAAVVAAVWAGSLDGPYHFDDHVTPRTDPASQGLAAWAEHLVRTLRPVTKLTYALEATAGLADTPAARRAVSLAFHAGSAVLLFLLVARLTPRLPRAGAATIALLWALHPVHAESVLAIAGRSSAMGGCFALAALVAYAHERHRLAAVGLALAALSRETAIAAALPLVVLELGAPRRAGERAARLAPCAVAVLLAATWIAATPRYQVLADYSFLGRPVAASAVAQVAAVPVGLLLYLDPSRLSIDHGVPLPTSPASVGFVAGLALFFAAAAAAWLARRRSPALAVGAALWLAAIAPTQSIVPKLDPLTERPLSLALAGLALAGSPLVARLVGRRAGGARPRTALAGAVAAAALAAALAGATARRGALYASGLLLWGDAARKSQVNPRPHINYALQLEAAGRVAEARAALEAARRIDPLDARAAVILDRLSVDEEER